VTVKAEKYIIENVYNFCILSYQNWLYLWHISMSICTLRLCWRLDFIYLFIPF